MNAITIRGLGTRDFDTSTRVRITSYGKRYHTNERCRYLDHCAGSDEVSRSYAEYKGKTACPECEPR